MHRKRFSSSLNALVAWSPGLAIILWNINHEKEQNPNKEFVSHTIRGPQWIVRVIYPSQIHHGHRNAYG